MSIKSDGNAVPTYKELLNATLSAIRALGGTARNNEITDQVIEALSIPDEVSGIVHVDGRKTSLEYNLAWARTNLKWYGMIDNHQRGLWTFTEKGLRTKMVDEDEVVRRYLEEKKNKRDNRPAGANDSGLDDDPEQWKDELLRTLKNIEPDAFERLCQQILRRSDFTEVEVTGRSGDGGIDGKGIIQLGRLLSVPVVFQCKRWDGSVGSRTVRDFRGAMVGRAEQGLIITTASFTKNARDEATRMGAAPIDLIDGEALLDLLKDLELGVKTTTRTVEEVEVEDKFFNTI